MASVQLQWMDEYSVSTLELKSAAKKLPRLIVSKEESPQDETESIEQFGDNHHFDNENEDAVIHEGGLGNESAEKLDETYSGLKLQRAECNEDIQNDDEKHENNSVNRSKTKLNSQHQLGIIDMQLNNDVFVHSECNQMDNENGKWKMEHRKTKLKTKSSVSNSAVPSNRKSASNEIEGTHTVIIDEKERKAELKIDDVVFQQQAACMKSGDSIKLPPIVKSTNKPVVTNYQNHITSSINFSSAFGKSTFPSHLRIPKYRSSDYKSPANKKVFRSENSHEVRSNNLEFLQLSPLSGGAMSYSSAMSRNHIARTDEQCGRITQRTGKRLFIPFRYRDGNLSPDTHHIVKKQFPITEHGFPSLPSKSPNIDYVTQEVKRFEEKLEDQHLKKVDRLRQKHIQKKATLIEIEEVKNFDDSHLVKFDVDEKMKNLVHKLRGGVINSLDNLTNEIREEYDDFLTQVDQVTYYQLRQAEAILNGYTPRTVVVISSSVPKSEVLVGACRAGVLNLVYDVGTETYSTLIEKMKSLLNSYMKGAKMRNLAIVTKGGPGYMYLLKKNPITPQKLLKEKELLRFWKDLGRLMSKISVEPSCIHLMESNVAGNTQGEMDLEAAMFAHKVVVDSPLEVSIKGKEMIKTYFVPEKFKEWKQNRYKGRNT